MASRPKPWEASSGTSVAVASGQSSDLPPSSAAQGQPFLGTAPSTNTDPSTVNIPERPTSLTSDPLNTIGSSSLGGYGSSLGGSYGSRYGGMSGMSGMGGYGSSMYGGMGGLGGYGSMYGGMGGYGMGGMGGYGMGGYGMGGYGMNGMNGEGNGGFAESTQATFHIIESFIGAIAGFTQMLEATYMATHSSFFTMISVAEQFGNLKNALGSFLGIFAMVKWIKKLVRKLVGWRENIKIDMGEFQKFEAKKLQDSASNSTSGPNKKRISLKPLLIFLGMVIGTPIILKKIIDYLNHQQLQRQRLAGAQPLMPGQLPQQPTSLDSIEFGRVLYDFFPENPKLEIELKKDDLVAVLMKTDPMGKPSQWWKVRSRDGKEGYFPGNYVELIPRQITSPPAPGVAQTDAVEEPAAAAAAV